MSPNPLLLMLACGTLALAGCTAPARDQAVAGPASEALEVVPMISHVQLGVFEMDVFIERPGDAGRVWRPTPAESTDPAMRDATLFSTRDETPHDPSFTNAGPFDAGGSLGFTLSRWLEATGSVAYLCTGGATAQVSGAFSGLVPDSVYTIWNARLDFREGKIVGGADIPLGAPDGSQSPFRSDAQGNARVTATWPGCNEPSTAGPGIGPTGSARVFAAAYHSDGQTHGATPGPFGQRTHVQLFGIVKAAPAA